MNIAAALLSIILAFLLLSPILMLGYFVLTSIFIAIFFMLRTRLHTRPRSKAPEPQQEINLEPLEETHNQRALWMIFLIIIVMIASPLLLARALDPYVWFLSMLSLIAGFSIAEILFYFYTR